MEDFSGSYKNILFQNFFNPRIILIAFEPLSEINKK